MLSADVTVVGAGVMGASLAWHLTAMGCRSVLLLDRGQEPGTGSTGRATGGFRSQFASAINVQLSLRSREKLRIFREETGGECGYDPVGYLFLATDPSQLSILADAMQVQRAAGLMDTAALTLDDIARINPNIVLDGVAGASFGPTDGYIRPLGILHGYLDAAVRAGARIEYGTEPLAFERTGGRITAVTTSRGKVATGHVVNAAGAWARGVAALAGFDLPVEPVRRQVAITEPTSALPARTPLTIFADDGFHFRVRDGRALLLWPVETRGRDPHDTTFDPAWLDGVIARTHRRIPSLRNVAIDRSGCWCGLYEMSPDHHAILGAAPGHENFWLMNGSSGHGVMHSPILGQLLAEMILTGQAQSLDVSALRPSRFMEGALNPAPVLL